MGFRKWKFKLGIGMIVVSIVIFLMLFSLPFLSISTKIKIALSTIFLVAGEGMFWLGIVLIGKDVYLKFKEKVMSGEWKSKKNGKKTGPEQN